MVLQMIAQFIEISLTLVGDGSSRDLTVDLNKLPQSTLDSLPPFAPIAVLSKFSALIDPDGSTRADATITLSGPRTITVTATNPLQSPADNLARYQLNLILLYPMS
jgi:hypothetical protein